MSTREQSADRAACVVAEVVPADLAVIVREAVRERLRFRQQQQPHVLVGVAREQHDLGRLKVLRAALQIRDAGDAARIVRRRSTSRARSVTTLSGRVVCAFGIVVTAVEPLALTWQPPRVAEAVIHARRCGSGSVRELIAAGPGNGVPSEAARGGRHHLGEAGAAQRRHRILAVARALRRCCRARSIVPLMLPALPETPISYSTLS